MAPPSCRAVLKLNTILLLSVTVIFDAVVNIPPPSLALLYKKIMVEFSSNVI